MAVEGFTPEVECKCPCGGDISAGYTTDDQTPAVFHSMPPCQKFIDLDPIEFLQYVNAAVASN